MTKRSKRIVLTCGVFLSMLLTACLPVGSEGQQTGTDAETYDSMEEEPVLTYDVPVSTPGVLVDRVGYLPAENKTVLFKGNRLPAFFSVVDVNTDAVSYVGMLQESSKGQDGISRAAGDFSAVTEPGSYYIQTPVLGQSYSFVIAEDVYDELFREACKQYYYSRCGMTLGSEYAGDKAHNACHTGKSTLRTDGSVSMDVTGGWHQNEAGEKNVVVAARTMSMLLLSYELYGSSFSDEAGIPESGNGIPDLLDEVRYEADWLLKMQDQQTGAVYAGVSAYQNTNSTSTYVEPAESQSELAFAAVLAQFGYLYQTYDEAYATTCLKAADRAYKHAMLDEEKARAFGKEPAGNLRFAASAQLYRASGQNTYQAALKESLSQDPLFTEEDEWVLFGSIAYLSTKQPVKAADCEKLMKILMNRAEEISEEARGSFTLTAGNMEDKELLLDIAYLTAVNHIIPNYEYTTLMENHLHYFLGRNDGGTDYIQEGTGESAPALIQQFEPDSKLIFLISGIL